MRLAINVNIMIDIYIYIYIYILLLVTCSYPRIGCFRLYLVNSPSVRAENLKFKADGVRDVLKDVFLPWFNAYRFLMQNVERLERGSCLFSLFSTLN